MSAARPPDPELALRGTLVLDATRMLPGGVLARMMLELGARVIKVEDPRRGDPLRFAPPLVDGVGVGFRLFYAGAESITLDLRRPDDAAELRELARHADVLLESFRPGRLEQWGLAPPRLAALNPRLVVCSLSAFGGAGEAASRVGHDLNFVGLSGLLELLPGTTVPRVQIADVGAALLACSAVLAALLRRERTGRGAHVDQPLADGPRPFVAWAQEERRAGGGGVGESVLAGCAPGYRIYECRDRLRLAVCALEPKFWAGLTDLLELPELHHAGLATGAEGEEAIRRVQERFALRDRAEWIELAESRGLPISPVHDLDAARRETERRTAGRDRRVRAPGFLGSIGRAPRGPAPALGEHTGRVLARLGRGRPDAGRP